MYGLTPVQCRMHKFIIRSKTKNCWTAIRYILPISLRKEWIRHAGGSSLCTPLRQWYSTVYLIRLLFPTVWYWIRTVIKCPNVWAMPSIRSLRSRNTVPTHCVGIWLRILLHGIIWSSIWMALKRCAVSSSVHCITRIHSLHCMPM